MTSSSSPPAAYPTATCGCCPAPIIWASTTGGRLMPVDAAPAEGGNVRLDGEPGRQPVATVVSKTEAQGMTGLRWPHFATCPNWHKRRGAR